MNKTVDPKKIDWTSIDTQIKHEGKAIVLPGDPTDMDYDSAIATIERVKKDEMTEFDVTETVKGGPWDALTCVYRAMQEIYGVVTVTGIPSWFGTMRPDMISVSVGHRGTDVVQVPVGNMNLPNVAKPITLGLHKNGVDIRGVVKKKERARIVELANKAREILAQASIYRGKAIRLKVDDDGDLELRTQPEFLDLDRVQVSDMIHTAETSALIETNIFSPLRNTAACRKHRIPLKRGILLEGKYGTGKSLTARVTAKVAADNGWTFIMLDRAQGLKTAIEFARPYQPCVIFAEDIDRAADRNEESVNDLVNLLDGVVMKNAEMMVVLTTNFVERIDRALLRPGRFDSVISIQNPDPETVGRLIRAYARDLIAEDADITPASNALAGQIPATIREVVERAKLSMLTEGRSLLTTADLQIAALGMKRHLDLLNPPTDVETDEQALWKALSKLVSKSAGGATAVEVDLEDIEDTVGAIDRRVRGVADTLDGVHKVTKSTAAASVALMDKSDAIAKKVGVK